MDKMEQKHPVGEVVELTMDKLREMIDVNTVVGDPIHTPEGVTVIPVSKVSMGLVSGGSDFSTKNQPPTAGNAYGGASSAGINIMPLAFLIIKGDNVRLLPVESSSSGPLDKALDLLPELMTKISAMIDQKKAEKAEKAEKKAAESGQGDPTKEK